MRRALLAVLAALTLLLTACGSGGGDTGAPVTNIRTNDDDGYAGIKLDDDYTVPKVTLTDTSGKPFDLATQTKRTVVFFGYTKCPDICQVVMSTIGSAVSRLPKADQAKLQVAFVTTDPKRDTRSVLRTYLDRFNPAFVGVTGDIDQIDALGKPLGIFIKQGQKLPSGGYEVEHTTTVVGVKGGQGDVVWTAATSPGDLAADLAKILKADAA